MVMIEEALGTGGMGSLLFESLRNYDVPVVMGALLVIGVIALASRLLLEIATAYLDPRLRFVGNAQESAARTLWDFPTKAVYRSWFQTSCHGSNPANTKRIRI